MVEFEPAWSLQCASQYGFLQSPYTVIQFDYTMENLAVERICFLYWTVFSTFTCRDRINAWIQMGSVVIYINNTQFITKFREMCQLRGQCSITGTDITSSNGMYIPHSHLNSHDVTDCNSTSATALVGFEVWWLSFLLFQLLPTRNKATISCHQIIMGTKKGYKSSEGNWTLHQH